VRARKDRRLCRTCVSYYQERYGYCELVGKRVQGHIGGWPCWKRRSKKSNARSQPEPASGDRLHADVGGKVER